MKRVALVVPPADLRSRYGRMASIAPELPMLGLAYVAAALRQSGHDVRVLDCPALRLGTQALLDELLRFRPNVVGMQCFINNVQQCLDTARIVKSRLSSIRVVIGGPHATIFPQEVGNDPNVDIVVIGEGDVTVKEVVGRLDDPDALRDVSGTGYMCGKDFLTTPSRPVVRDLDSLPFPALDLFPIDRYYPAAHIQGRRVAHLLTSRGCTYDCRFCAAKLVFGRTCRFHSVDRVIAEVNYQIDAFKCDSFIFYDDSFTINRRRALELCDGILRNGRRIKWTCFTRTDLVDLELLKAMKTAGCYLVTFGCESGNQELLDLVRKGNTVEQNALGISMAKQAGLLTLASFMLGLPTETREQTLRTIDFAVDSELDYAVFPITEPYPGTELWDIAMETGSFIESGEFHNRLLVESSKIWVPHGRTRGELQALAYEAFRRFYLRPRIIARNLRGLTTRPPSRSLRLIAGGLHYFATAPFRAARSRF